MAADCSILPISIQALFALLKSREFCLLASSFVPNIKTNAADRQLQIHLSSMGSQWKCSGTNLQYLFIEEKLQK